MDKQYEDQTITQYPIYSILTQLRGVKLRRNEVQSTIKNHLLKFRGKNITNSVYCPNEEINEICERACKLLLNDMPGLIVDKYGETTESEFPFEFKPEWLNHVGILLPGHEEIVKILPYLITCYTQNAISSSKNRNRIDPFSGENTIAWMEIFQECADTIQNERMAFGEGNRSRNIGQLANYFTDITKIDISCLLAEPTYEVDRYAKTAPYILRYSNHYAKMCPVKRLKRKNRCLRCPKQRRKNCHKKNYVKVARKNSVSLTPIYTSKQNMNSTEWAKISVMARSCAEAWERYRIFAALCEACKDNENVNITLSMALFSSSWEIKSYKNRGSVNSLFIEDIYKDFRREEILKMLEKGPEPDIYLNTLYAKYVYACCKAKKLPSDGIF